MTIKGKGKYDGKKKVELDQELNLPPDTEIFFIIEDIKPLSESAQSQKQDKTVEEHPLLQIIKRARPAHRTDLSEKYHEILSDSIE